MLPKKAIHEITQNNSNEVPRRVHEETKLENLGRICPQPGRGL